MYQNHRLIKRRKRLQLAPYLFLLPFFIPFIIFVVWPIIHTFYLSFLNWRLTAFNPPQFVGISNYVELFNDKIFWLSLKNTAYYTISVVPIGICISLFLAILMNQKIPLRGMFRAVYFLPVIISMVVVSLMWQWIFDQDMGAANILLKSLGFPPQNWLSNERLAMPAIIFTALWKGVGYNMVILLAGLQTIPVELREAARIDGANSWQDFRYITLPLLKPTMLFVLIMATLGSFQVFDLVYVMTGGGPGQATKVLILYIYEKAFQFWAMSRAAAMGVILFIILLGLTIIQLRFFRGEIEY